MLLSKGEGERSTPVGPKPEYVGGQPIDLVNKVVFYDVQLVSEGHVARSKIVMILVDF